MTTTLIQSAELSSFKTDTNAVCPACSNRGLTIFYEVANVPVHSCLMLSSEREASDFPCGNIALGFCAKCGFITNTAYNLAMADYAPNYEDQQSFSPTFNKFAHSLATGLIEKYSLKGKEIVEIGCSKGDFLLLMCELAGGTGVGIDPSAVVGRVESAAASRVKFIQDYYSEKHSQYRGDLIACRHTLEHIHPVHDFVANVRRVVGDHRETVIFFELPDTARVLEEQAFWDIYYEHCSYFTAGSLARLFRRCSFEILSVERAYGDQYLLLEALPSELWSDNGSPGLSNVKNNLESLYAQPNAQPREIEESEDELLVKVAEFAERVQQKLNYWKQHLSEMQQQNKKVAVWGSGSKCVAFLTSLHAADAVQCVIDINPHRHGKFIPGVAKEIMSPEYLKTFMPDEVLVMNPIYVNEIGRMLDEMGVRTQLVPV